MTITTRQTPCSLWPVALAATLALTSGCSGDREEKAELVPECDHRGVLTYRYVLAGRSAATSSNSPKIAPGRQQTVYLERRQPQQYEWNYRQARAEREDRLRHERQEPEAYQESRRQYEKELRRQPIEQQPIYQQQQQDVIEQQRERAQLEAMQRQQAAREYNDAVQRNFQQQQYQQHELMQQMERQRHQREMMYQNQGWNR